MYSRFFISFLDIHGLHRPDYNAIIKIGADSSNIIECRDRAGSDHEAVRIALAKITSNASSCPILLVTVRDRREKAVYIRYNIH